MADKWYTVSEASSLLGVSTETVRRHIKSGKVDGRKEGNQYVVKLTNTNETDQHNVAQMTDMKLNQLESEKKLLEEHNQMLRERVSELEQDKGFLLSQISEKDRLIDKLTPLALPEPKVKFRRLKRIFGRSDSQSEK